MRTGRAAAVAIVAMCVTGCSPAPTTRELAARALTAMGGEARVRGIRHFTMTGGTGSRSQLGQGTTATATETPSTLTSVVETIDLANRRAAFAYEVTTSGGFSQRRREIRGACRRYDVHLAVTQCLRLAQRIGDEPHGDRFDVRLVVSVVL